MLESLFAAAAETVFTYILEYLDPAEHLRDWLKRGSVRLAYQHALARTYAAFARQYPELTASLFNESFLTIEAVPELAKFLTRHQHPDHTQLVRLWAKSITPQTETGRQAVEALSKREDLNAASAYFVDLLTSGLKYESALQPLFDSRALESLPAIEARLDQLTDALNQALMIATHYEQTVVNRSGGVDFQAQQINIDGDVVGRDKIVSNTYNTYFTGSFETLDDLYVRPDAVFQRVHVQDFVGREWLTAKVDAFLNDEKRKSGVFLLVGEAGVGKTSFMAHLVTERRYLHLFAEQVPGDVNVTRALQSLGAQLVARYQIDPYKEKGTLPAVATFPDFLYTLLLLASDKRSAGEKIVIVCDALDEAGTAPNGNVFGLPSVLPDGVYFLLSQRPVTVKLSVRADLVRETIDATGADNLHDVEQYLVGVSRRPEIANQLHAHNYTPADFVRILEERSGGVWMYLFYVISEISVGHRAPLDLDALPSGLAGYYNDYWGDWCEGRNGRGEGPGKWDAVYAPLLATLAAAQVPIGLDLLLAWAKVSATEYEVERLLRRHWRAFITEREIDGAPHFALYHASLRDFLTRNIDRQSLTLEAEQLTDELAHRTRGAHVRIVEHYRRKCDGDWVKLIEDDYVRTYLCLHLSASGNDETMYQLVAMSNAWAEAKYAQEESYAGYLVDLNRAWHYAETDARWDVYRQIRCALIESSIHSLTGNIRSELLALLVETKLWSPARALSHVSQIIDAQERTESLGAIVGYLPLELRAEAMVAACSTKDEFFRARALSILIPHLPDELKTEAVAGARAISDKRLRALALTNLLPHVPNDLKVEVRREALAAALVVLPEDDRAPILARLGPHLPDDLKANVLTAARAISDDYWRAHVLISLLSGLSDELAADALVSIRAISDESVRASAWVALLPYMSAEEKAKALPTVRTISNAYDRARALTGLAPYLPDNLKAEALAIACEPDVWEDSWRADAVVGLAPFLSDELKAEALSMIRGIEDAPRADALAGLAPYLSEKLKAEALGIASTIVDAYDRAKALAGLAPHLSDELKANALGVARAISEGHSRAYALAGIAPHLPSNLRIEITREALVAAQVISIEDSRPSALIDLLPHLPIDLKTEVIDKALISARSIADDYWRARALTSLLQYLPDNLVIEVGREALIASAVSDERARPQPLRSGIYPPRIGSNRHDALTRLAPHLPTSLKAEALSIACAISDEHWRVQVLTSLAPHLPNDLKARALDAACAISNEYERTDALIGLAPYLPNDLKAKTLAAARAISDEYSRACILASLLPLLPDDLNTEVSHEALAVAHAACTTSEYWDSSWRARALVYLFPRLPGNLRTEVSHEVFTAACGISEVMWRAQALADLARQLPDDLKTEALNAARAIADENYRAEALAGLGPHMPDDLKAEVLNATRTLSDERCRAKVITSLAPHLPSDLNAEAVSAARALSYERDRAGVLTSLAPYLLDDLKVGAVVEAFLLATKEWSCRTDIYIRLMPIWQELHFRGLQTPLWTEALHALARDSRYTLIQDLSNLIPLIQHLGDHAAAEHIYDIISDVTYWWP